MHKNGDVGRSVPPDRTGLLRTELSRRNADAGVMGSMPMSSYGYIF